MVHFTTHGRMDAWTHERLDAGETGQNLASVRYTARRRSPRIPRAPSTHLCSYILPPLPLFVIMKLIKKGIDQYKAGFFTLRAQDPEDLWHVYHLLQQGDLLAAKTFRYADSSTIPYPLSLILFPAPTTYNPPYHSPQSVHHTSVLPINLTPPRSSKTNIHSVATDGS